MTIVLWKLASSNPLPTGVSELLCVKLREDFNSVEKVDLTKIVNVLILKCPNHNSENDDGEIFLRLNKYAPIA